MDSIFGLCPFFLSATVDGRTLMCPKKKGLAPYLARPLKVVLRNALEAVLSLQTEEVSV